MDMAKKAFHYTANLQWTEKVQTACVFCNTENLKDVVYEDEAIIAFKNIRNSGQSHWLIVPKTGDSCRHIRDIEALTADDLPLLLAMDEVKKHLLIKYHPDLSPSSSTIHAGYHRGRRQLIGSIFLPDIVSVHHIHLHIIVGCRPVVRWFKYPAWLPLMWKSDRRVIGETRKRKVARMSGD